jgi:hypothetical protein
MQEDLQSQTGLHNETLSQKQKKINFLKDKNKKR